MLSLPSLHGSPGKLHCKDSIAETIGIKCLGAVFRHLLRALKSKKALIICIEKSQVKEKPIIRLLQHFGSKSTQILWDNMMHISPERYYKENTKRSN